MSAERIRRSRGEEGFTLVEMLVALMIASVLGAILVSTLVASQRSVKLTVNVNDITAQARTALNRISEDLQQAVPLTTVGPPIGSIAAITAVSNPDGPRYSPTDVTSFTFNADFNGSGCVNGVSVATDNISPATAAPACPASALSASSPDIETVCWGGANDQVLYLISGAANAGTCNPQTGNGTPLLSGMVSGFEVFYRSSMYLYGSGGITTWYNLDAAGPPVGNDDGVFDSPELGEINAVLIRMTVSEAGHTQTFQTEVNLRNVA